MYFVRVCCGFMASGPGRARKCDVGMSAGGCRSATRRIVLMSGSVNTYARLPPAADTVSHLAGPVGMSHPCTTAEHGARERLPDAKADPFSRHARGVGFGDDPKAVEGETMRALRALLKLANPDGDWGELTRVLTPEGHRLWLCPEHRKEYER